MVPGDSPGHLAAGRPRQAHRQECQEVRAGAGADQGGYSANYSANEC